MLNRMIVFVFLFGIQTAFALSTCGSAGSLYDRIKDCNLHFKGLSLVTRTTDLHEVYFDHASDLLWSDRLAQKMNHYDAGTACESILPEMGDLGVSDWRLPSMDEFYLAEKRNRISEYLPNRRHVFWTSTVWNDSEDYAYIFKGHTGFIFSSYRDDTDISVRCVAELMTSFQEKL